MRPDIKFALHHEARKKCAFPNRAFVPPSIYSGSAGKIKKFPPKNRVNIYPLPFEPTTTVPYPSDTRRRPVPCPSTHAFSAATDAITAGLDIKLEEHHIPIFHDVFFAFHAV